MYGERVCNSEVTLPAVSSLLQRSPRSPSPSDLETLLSRKPSYSRPSLHSHHTLTTPHHTLTAHHHTLTAPRHTLTAPHHTLTAPHHTLTAPRHTLTSPHHTLTAPHHTLTSQREETSSLAAPLSSLTSAGKSPLQSNSTLAHSRRPQSVEKPHTRRSFSDVQSHSHSSRLSDFHAHSHPHNSLSDDWLYSHTSMSHSGIPSHSRTHHSLESRPPAKYGAGDAVRGRGVEGVDQLLSGGDEFLPRLSSTLAASQVCECVAVRVCVCLCVLRRWEGVCVCVCM